MTRHDHGAPDDPLNGPSLSAWAGAVAADLDGLESRGLAQLPDVDGVPSHGMTLTYDADAGVWRPEYPAAALSVIRADYRWTEALADPDTGRVGIDAADPLAATAVHIHRTDSQGRDTGPIVEQLDAGAWVNVHDRTDAGIVYRFDVTGDPVLTGDVYAVPVVVYDAAGTMAPNARVSVVMRFTALTGAG